MKKSRLDQILVSYLGFCERALSASRLSHLLGVTREHASRKLMRAAEVDHVLEPVGVRGVRIIDPNLDRIAVPIRNPRGLMDILPGLRAITDGGESLPAMEGIGNLIAPEGEPDRFWDLYASMARHEAVLIEYRSKMQESLIWFSPHTLVDIPHRPHFRGYMRSDATGYSQFVDLVPSRISRTLETSREAYVTGSEDALWNQRTDLRFCLAEGLPDGVRGAVIQEWGCELREMNDGPELLIRGVRLALASYVAGALRWRVYQEVQQEVWVQKTPIEKLA